MPSKKWRNCQKQNIALLYSTIFDNSYSPYLPSDVIFLFDLKLARIQLKVEIFYKRQKYNKAGGKKGRNFGGFWCEIMLIIKWRSKCLHVFLQILHFTSFMPKISNLSSSSAVETNNIRGFFLFLLPFLGHFNQGAAVNSLGRKKETNEEEVSRIIFRLFHHPLLVLWSVVWVVLIVVSKLLEGRKKKIMWN